MPKDAKRILTTLLEKAGITVNGNKPWDIQVHDERFYSRALSAGSLGLGESYMDKWWDVKEIDSFLTRILLAGIDKEVITKEIIIAIAKAKLFNMQSLRRSRQVAEVHYDLDNAFYEKMLDKNMQYSCGYWKNAKNLDQAQEQKLDLICKKLDLKKGDKLLDIGCGWGGLARYAAKNYKCEVTGYTISKEQAAYAREFCKGLPVTIIQKDYRLIEGAYDKIVSVGMFEHVGTKNFRTYMKVVRRCLKDDGLFLLHTMGQDARSRGTEPWLHKYIFPNGVIPSLQDLASATESLLVMEDWHNFGAYYDLTLLEWAKNFERNWRLFKDKFGERFYRMWRYYLANFTAVSRSRKVQLWQVVYSKEGIPKGYKSIR